MLLAVPAAVLFLETGIWLGLRRFKQGRSWQRWAAGAALVLLAPVAVLALFARFAPLESPYSRIEPAGPVVLDSNGVVLQRDTSAGLRIPVGLEQVAPIMVEATIAAEDARFRSHPGVDPVAAVRSLLAMPFRRSGASTLTQQLARRLYLSDFDGPVIERKAREGLIALQLEARYSKDEVLELYLNNVYYGQGAYGIEAAARVYFGISAANLDLAQAAFLAGLPQLPAYYGADPQSQATLARRRYVLDRLVETRRVSADGAEAAEREALRLLPPQGEALAPHFVRFALDELGRLRPDLAGRGDVVIETTLDAGLQLDAEDIVRHSLERLKDRGVGNGAVVVLDPANGRILTMVGSAGFSEEDIAGQINMTAQPRQPGSALKPFLYLTALDKGFTAATPLLDIPVSFTTAAGPYTPLNYDRRFNGVVPLRVALASSLNVPAVRTLAGIGVEEFLEVAHRFGLRTLTDAEVYGLALTLGGGEVRLLDLTAAYGALAAGGRLNEPYAVERVLDQAGRVLYERAPSSAAQVAAPEQTFIIADILADPIARQLGFGSAPQLELPFEAAVKTGTTTEFRDNWTLGFTPQRVVGVWVGNADNRPMVNVSGVTGAAPIWRAVMEAAHKGLVPSWPAPPPGLVRAPVCSPTGMKPGPDCPAITDEWFLAGTAPQEVEDYYSLDAAGRLLVNPPVEARNWALGAGLPLLAEPAEAGGAIPIVVFPGPGSRFFMAPEVPGQSLLLRASAPPGVLLLEFWIDGQMVGTAPPDDPVVLWPLQPGSHELQVKAISARGESASVSSRFEVSR